MNVIMRFVDDTPPWGRQLTSGSRVDEESPTSLKAVRFRYSNEFIRGSQCVSAICGFISQPREDNMKSDTELDRTAWHKGVHIPTMKLATPEHAAWDRVALREAIALPSAMQRSRPRLVSPDISVRSGD